MYHPVFPFLLFFPIPSSSLPSSCCLRVEVWLVEKQELTMILPGIYFEKLKPREGRSFLAPKIFLFPDTKVAGYPLMLENPS